VPHHARDNKHVAADAGAACGREPVSGVFDEPTNWNSSAGRPRAALFVGLTDAIVHRLGLRRTTQATLRPSRARSKTILQKGHRRRQ
jgi:hypothetical protein